MIGNKTGYLLIFAVGVIVGSFLQRYISRILRKEPGGSWPMAELLNGLLYVLVIGKAGWTIEGMLFCICTSMLLAIGIIDQRTFEIPIGCTILIGILGAVRAAVDLTHWYLYPAGMLVAGGFLLIIYLATKGKGIGRGDVKLMASAGLLLGGEAALFALLIGSIAGVITHTILMRWMNKGRILAYGPYLAFGIFIAMLYA